MVHILTKEQGSCYPTHLSLPPLQRLMPNMCVLITCLENPCKDALRILLLVLSVELDVSDSPRQIVPYQLRFPHGSYYGAVVMLFDTHHFG